MMKACVCKLRWLLSMLLIWMPPVFSMDEQNVNPGFNAHYRDADVARWRNIFESSGREVWDQRYEILSALGLEPGMTVADIGAGTGFFTLMFAREVGPEGHVYAVDIAPNFIEAIRERAALAGLKNVTGIVNTQKSVELAAGSIDLAFICDTYHHFEYPLSAMRSLRAALKPNGEVVVIGFDRVPGKSSPWVLNHIRAGKAQFLKEIESTGFNMVEERDFLSSKFYYRFRKQDSEERLN